MAMEVTYPTQCLKEASDILDIVAQTFNAIDRFTSATATVSAACLDSESSDIKPAISDVEDCLKGLDELFSDADDEIQSEIISAIMSIRPSSLQILYKFANRVYNGGSI